MDGLIVRSASGHCPSGAVIRARHGGMVTSMIATVPVVLRLPPGPRGGRAAGWVDRIGVGLSLVEQDVARHNQS